MIRLALGAKCGGLTASGWVMPADCMPGAAGKLARRSLPNSDASATPPIPSLHWRRKWRRVVSWAYFSWRFMVASNLRFEISNLRFRSAFGQDRVQAEQYV